MARIFDSLLLLECHHRSAEFIYMANRSFHGWTSQLDVELSRFTGGLRGTQRLWFKNPFSDYTRTTMQSSNEPVAPPGCPPLCTSVSSVVSSPHAHGGREVER
jgi:hypothetical protein